MRSLAILALLVVSQADACDVPRARSIGYADCGQAQFFQQQSFYQQQAFYAPQAFLAPQYIPRQRAVFFDAPVYVPRAPLIQFNLGGFRRDRDIFRERTVVRTRSRSIGY